MLTLLSELKFMTSREDELSIKNTDFGVFKSSEKNSSANSTGDSKTCYYAKKDYGERRGFNNSLNNKGNAKLKSNLKHVEEEIKTKKVVFCGWMNEKLFQLMLSNGLLIYIEINIFTGDIKKINFDRYFIGKTVSENICDVIITRQHILISYNENQITFVHFQKPSVRNNVQKIATGDPKIFNIIVDGQTKKINRNLVINHSNDLVLIWTKSSQNEFFPWRPTVKDEERANLHIYKLNRLKFDLLCFYWTENDPIAFEFSTFNENEIHSVEQKISRKGEVTVESCTYYISSSKFKMQRTSVTSIPLQTEVSCSAFSPDHEKLFMGCIDGSVVLFDEGRGTTYLVKASFIPTQVTWHPDSSIIIIANERAQLQCFDISLSCIKNQLLSEEMTPSNVLDLSGFFVRQPMLQKIGWSKKPDINYHYEKYAQVDNFLLLYFQNGIFASLRYIGGTGLKNDIHTSGLTADVIIQMYISLDQIDKAINVLLSLNWDSYGALCLLSLHKIANYIFKQPAIPEMEELLQKALSSFHIPTRPLCTETENEFGDNVDDITRRFFHYLIRNKSFEKAFSLAIDINDADLFMILHKCAKSLGVSDLANEAFKKVEEIYAKEEIDSHHSTCSITSCSICSNSYHTDSEEESEAEIYEQENNVNAEEMSDEDFGSEIKKTPERELKKSVSVDILNHPPLPRFPRFDVKNFQKSEKIPPLPNFETLPKESHNSLVVHKRLTSSELTLQNVTKFNKTSSKTKFKTVDPPSTSTFDPMSLFNSKNPHNIREIREILPSTKSIPEIDQTIGIPVNYDSADNSLNPYYIHPKDNNQNNEFQPSTTIHTYPLISGTIPSMALGTQLKNISTLPLVSTLINSKREIGIPTNSILSNSNNVHPTNSNSNMNKKEGGEKNKVKFSDTVHVAVVPEISRKEKTVNFNERIMKRKTYPPGYDPIKRELAASLPLCHPNEEYLKDFLPAPDKVSSKEEKKKPSIKVVNFGVL
ncbi:hypothetical protein ACKWTF_008043 [Chironomus riparius]